jgi:ribonuclease HI
MSCNLAIKLARNNMVSSVQSCPSIQAIVNENNLYLKDIIISQTPFFPPWTSISNMIDASLTSLPKNTTNSHIYIQEFKNILDQYSNFIKIYTDASKTENNVEIAINDIEEITYKLLVECSIYTIEAIAILKALEYSLEKQNNNFVILSDSLSSIISIVNTHKPNDISKKIQLAISAHHAKGNVIKLMWIPGHSSIEGNEKADMLAKKTALTTPNGIIANISHQDAKRTIKLISAKSWQNFWSTQRT